MAFVRGLGRPEGQYLVKAVEGLDTLRKEFDIGQKADIAQNMRFSPEVGGVTKRPALSFYNPVEEANSITSAYRYYQELTGTAYLIQLNGTTLRASTDGTFYTIATLSGSTGKRFTAITYNDLAIISTGYDNMVQTDGVVGWELGSCKASLATDTGNVDNGVHYYAVTFWVGGEEVVNGAFSNSVTCDGTHQVVNLSHIPLGPTGCTGRNIYRTEAGGSTLKLLVELEDNTTQEYEDDVADSSLTTDMPSVNSDMPKGLYLYVDQERLFVANDPTGIVKRRSTVYYSEQYLPHYIDTQSVDLDTVDAASNYEPIAPDDNDVLTGIKSFLGMTFVIKQNSIRNWNITGTPDTWELGGILSNVGCAAPYSLVETPSGLVFQGWNHMYLFNGQTVDPVMDVFNFDENFLDSRRAENVGYFWNNIYLLAYTDANDGNSYHDRILVYDILRQQMAIDKGGPLSTGGKANINCFTSFKGSGEWGQLYVGDSLLGWVYQYDRVISSVVMNTITGFNLGKTFVGGLIWTERFPETDPYKTWIATSDSDGSNLFVTYRIGRAYISTDAGENWAETKPIGSTNGYWACLASDADGSVLIIAEDEAGTGRVYLSINGGTSWAETQPAGNVKRHWGCLASDSDGSVLLAGVYNGRIYLTINGGTDWNEIFPTGGAHNATGSWRIALDSDGSTILIADYNGRVWLSTDSGTNFTETRPAGDDDKLWSGVASNNDGSILAACAINDRVYISTNGGTDWTEVQPDGDSDWDWTSVALNSDGTKIVVSSATPAT